MTHLSGLEAPIQPGSLNRFARAVIWALPVALFIAASAFSVRLDQARMVVRWAPAVAADPRAQVAEQFGLVSPSPIEVAGVVDPDAQSFLLINPDAHSLSALRGHAAVRSITSAEGALADALRPRLSITRTPAEEWLVEWRPQSTVLFMLAGALLAGSMTSRRSLRIIIVSTCLLAFAGAAFWLPLDSRMLMGDVGTYDASKGQFDDYFSATAVRFEAHLSSLILRRLHEGLGNDDASPARAFTWLARGAMLWFVAMLLVVAAASGGFTPKVLRYLALSLAMPASLMYFGYRELGYLSLTPAAFPLVVQGLRGLRGRLEAGSALCGLGAALHGFGVLSIAGTAAAALVPLKPGEGALVSSKPSLPGRLGLVAVAVAFALTAYLGWVFVYIVGWELIIAPGHAAEIPWRPLMTSFSSEMRVNWAILSPRGALDIGAALWMAGVPLALAAATVWRRSDVAGPVLAYVLPSAIFMCVFWPVQGLAVDTDLVVGAFPGIYALAWLLAESRRGTLLGLLVLLSSHCVFWRVVFDNAFVSSRV